MKINLLSCDAQRPDTIMPKKNQKCCILLANILLVLVVRHHPAEKF
jgi:hypothetical protein